jgi:hypothetical protein
MFTCHTNLSGYMILQLNFLSGSCFEKSVNYEVGSHHQHTKLTPPRDYMCEIKN